MRFLGQDFSKSTATMKNVAAVLGASGFKTEGFVPLSDRAHRWARLPKEEVLLHLNGVSAETFFGNLEKSPKLIVPTDYAILERAFGKFQSHTRSFNANSATIFGYGLFEFLNRTPHDPKFICLEITEHGGGRPDGRNLRNLEKLKNAGYGIAVDDFDPRSASEWDRLAELGPFADIIKLPYQIMETLRHGENQNIADIVFLIEAVRTTYPDIFLVMEGVRATDAYLIPDLEKMGIDIYQKSPYGDPELIAAHTAAGLELLH